MLAYLPGGLAGFGGLGGVAGLLAGCTWTGGGGGAPGFKSVTLPFFIETGGGGSLNLFVFTFSFGNLGAGGGVAGAGGGGGVWLKTGAAKNIHPISSIHTLFFINQFFVNRNATEIVPLNPILSKLYVYQANRLYNVAI